MTEMNTADRAQEATSLMNGATEAMRLEFEPFIDEKVREFIADALDYHSMAATGLRNFFPVKLVLRGERGDVLGGLIGQIWGGWLHVTHLWVAEAVRGAGQGTRLLQWAEHYARSHGAVGATLDTFSFQAGPFYEKLGYTQFGTLQDYPPGHSQLYFSKRFEPR